VLAAPLFWVHVEVVDSNHDMIHPKRATAVSSTDRETRRRKAEARTFFSRREQKPTVQQNVGEETRAREQGHL
jgi:hypothetical protein